MPNKSEVGYADYVLYDDAHRPLAVIEAKRTCVDPSKGRQQATGVRQNCWKEIWPPPGDLPHQRL